MESADVRLMAVRILVVAAAAVFSRIQVSIGRALMAQCVVSSSLA